MANIKESLDRAERIGVIGSPSSTSELTIDLLGTAVNKKLVGNLAFFKFNQDGNDHYALGQITQIILHNIWTQDPTMRGLIRQKGRVDPITERQDTHTAKMTISSVFAQASNRVDQSIFGTVPSTGTEIRLLNEQVLNSLLMKHQNELFYLGNAYGTNILLPMWFKHFGSGVMGAGEAYHIGIFGKTGSGKSVLAKMIMMAYARHTSMSIFVLDPQGEFSRDFQEKTKIQRMFRELSRDIEIFSLYNLVLTGDDLLKKILVNSGFFERLGIVHEDNRIRAANVVLNILKCRGQIKRRDQDVIPPYKAYTKDAFTRVWRELHTEETLLKIYTSQDPRDRVRGQLEGAEENYYYDLWRRITSLFRYDEKENAIIIKDLVRKIHEKKGLIAIIDLSETNVPEDILWNDKMRLIVIDEFLKRITNEAEYQFKQNQLLNCMVIIDEAHRLAPRRLAESEELKQVKQSLIDAVRTTRKYGLGWLFISQTLSSLDREIINQTRIYIFGFGLAWGIERQALQEIIGGQQEAIALYQRFQDPQSSIGDKIYSFMTVGPISPLSFSGTPLFFNVLKYPSAFIKTNFSIRNIS